MNKELLIDALCGTCFPSMGFADDMTNEGLAIHTGNQWNPDWEWDRKGLNTLSTSDLQELYTLIKTNEYLSEPGA